MYRYMYRLHLTDEQMRELQRRTRQQGLMPRTRDRLEMLRLSHAGLSVPQIAAYLGSYDKTVRYWIKAFLASGGDFDALADQPHVGQKSAIGPEILEQVEQWLGKGNLTNHTYSSPQIAQKVEEQFGIRRSPCQWCRLLRRTGHTYKRTHPSVLIGICTTNRSPKRSPKSAPI